VDKDSPSEGETVDDFPLLVTAWGSGVKGLVNSGTKGLV